MAMIRGLIPDAMIGSSSETSVASEAGYARRSEASWKVWRLFGLRQRRNLLNTTILHGWALLLAYACVVLGARVGPAHWRIEFLRAAASHGHHSYWDGRCAEALWSIVCMLLRAYVVPVRVEADAVTSRRRPHVLLMRHTIVRVHSRIISVSCASVSVGQTDQG